MQRPRRKLCRRAAIAAIAAGAAFQVSSCKIDDSGIVDAFVDPAALSELRTQLIEGSWIGSLLDHVHGVGEEGVE